MSASVLLWGVVAIVSGVFFSVYGYVLFRMVLLAIGFLIGFSIGMNLAVSQPDAVRIIISLALGGVLGGVLYSLFSLSLHIAGAIFGLIIGLLIASLLGLYRHPRRAGHRRGVWPPPQRTHHHPGDLCRRGLRHRLRPGPDVSRIVWRQPGWRQPAPDLGAHHHHHGGDRLGQRSGAVPDSAAAAAAPLTARVSTAYQPERFQKGRNA